MSDENPTPDNEQYQQIDYVVKQTAQERSLLRRIGCGVLVVLWFAVLLLPIVMFFLAVQGDITIPRFDDVPDPQEHPLLQVRLVMEADYRGFGVTSTSVTESDNELCVQTNVRFLLWQGEGDPASFCDCYVRESDENEWVFASTAQGACD